MQSGAQLSKLQIHKSLARPFQLNSATPKLSSLKLVNRSFVVYTRARRQVVYYGASAPINYTAI